MLWTIAIILIVLWGLGMVRSHTMGGFIHVLICVALVLLVVQVVNGQGRFNSNQPSDHLNGWYESSLARLNQIEAVGRDQWDAVKANAESVWNGLDDFFDKLTD